MNSQYMAGNSMETTQVTPEKFPTSGYIRPKRLAELLAVCEATIWRYAKKPDFPKPIKLSSRATAFDASEIHAWLEAKKRLGGA